MVEDCGGWLRSVVGGSGLWWVIEDWGRWLRTSGVFEDCDG